MFYVPLISAPFTDSLRKKKQQSKADEAGDFGDRVESEGGIEEKESSLAASSSLSLIGGGGGGDSTLGGGGGHPASSYVNASTVVAAALAAAAAQRSATKATSATAPLPSTFPSAPPGQPLAHSQRNHKTENRWKPGSWLRRSFILLWRRRPSPTSGAIAAAPSSKPLPQDDIMRSDHHQSYQFLIFFA